MLIIFWIAAYALQLDYIFMLGHQATEEDPEVGANESFYACTHPEIGLRQCPWYRQCKLAQVFVRPYSPLSVAGLLGAFLGPLP